MLVDIATAPPPYKSTQDNTTEELKKRMAVRPAVERLINSASKHSGIETRCFVVPDAVEKHSSSFFSDEQGYFKPDTQARMQEYEKWAKDLSEKAVRKLVENNSYDVKNLKKIVTISCTGFFAPGLDYHLINKFDFSPEIKRTNIGFMGCAASLIGINSVAEAMKISEENSDTLLISVELCSLHLQTEPTRDNILANLIFADGCAAALFSNSDIYKNKTRFEIISTHSILFPDSADYMGWKIGNFGFEMMLSSDLPKIILDEAVPKAKRILKDAGLNIDEIKYWALHPGGRAILDSLQNGLELSDEKLIPSREVLKHYGNMSSASILYVLQYILNNADLKKDDYCCAMAFGPGLTMELVIFKGI